MRASHVATVLRTPTEHVLRDVADAATHVTNMHAR
jgi:hypothetical protein